MDKREEFIIDTLNVHGSFFHKKCIELISKIPSINVISKEFPVRVEDELTKIDIVAVRHYNLDYFYIIECKKADKDFKSWVFFPDTKSGEKDISVLTENTKLLLNIVVPEARINETIHKYAVKRSFLHPRDDRGHTIASDSCYDAYQIKLDYNKKGEINLSNVVSGAKKDDIEKACNQVLVGARGYANYILNKSVDKKPYKDKSCVILPIIITTANLFTCNTTPENISLSEGTVLDKEKIELKPAGWVIYHYKPNYLLTHDSDPISDNNKWYHDSFDFVSSVYVVNSDYLEEFLNKIIWSE